MSRVDGDSARPKHRITATDRVTNPSNASVPVLSSHQAAADAAEAKRLADAQLLEVAGAPTLAPGGTSTSTFFSDIARNKRNTDDAELSFSDTSADDGKKSAIASGGMSVSRIPAESQLKSITDDSASHSSDIPKKNGRKVSKFFLVFVYYLLLRLIIRQKAAEIGQRSYCSRFG